MGMMNSIGNLWGLQDPEVELTVTTQKGGGSFLGEVMSECHLEACAGFVLNRRTGGLSFFGQR